MKTYHTPAPWLVSGNTVYALMHDGWRKGVETLRNRFSASINVDRDCDAIETEANARLIAVAPELLEALDSLCNRIEKEGATPIDWNEFYVARSTIAKATGE